MSLTDTTAFQSLLDDGVAKGVAPGFQCVVFNRDSLIFNGVSGLATTPTPEAPEGKPFKKDTLVWIASCAKLCLSLIVFHIIEKGLTKSGFTMNDLDSHEALIAVLPEFKHGSGSLVTKIIEGFEENLDEDGRKVMKLRDAKGRVTLRMLLSHTAGFSYNWNNPLIQELFFPSDGSVPHFMVPHTSGNIRDFEIPLVNEPDTAYYYSVAGDWVGQFVVRASGRTLRELHKDIIFQPLGIPPSEADLWLPPSRSEAIAPLHTRDASKGWTHAFFYPFATEGEPPEGKAYHASGSIMCSLQAYAKVLQAVLRQDTAIVSKEVWQMATKDDLSARGLKIPRPEWKSVIPWAADDAEEYAKSTIADGAGANLLQCQTVSGRPKGSFGWAGFMNTYFFVDPTNDVGAIFGTQTFPFFEPGVVEMRDKLEALVYKMVGK